MDHTREMWSVPIFTSQKIPPPPPLLSTDVQLCCQSLGEKKYHSGLHAVRFKFPTLFFFLMSSYVVLDVASCCARLMLIDTNDKKETHREIPKLIYRVLHWLNLTPPSIHRSS